MTRRIFDVTLHGRVIGALRESDSGFVEFRFNDAYRNARPRDVLSQAFDDLDRAYVGKQRELPPFFANLVPEGELRPFLERHLPIERYDDLGLLEVVGRDLPGAVEVRRSAGVDEPDDAPQARTPDPIPPRELSSPDEELRFSLAGVQLKFSVVRAAEKVTLPVSGAHGDQILKLESKRFPGVVDNEYSMMRWAHHAGFDVPECEVVPTSALVGSLLEYAEDGVHALLIRRYDRTPERIHQEDFAQVLNARPANKYANVSYVKLANLVRTIVGPDALEEFIRRLVFMIASGNADAHLKNWSLIYPDRRTAQLAPLYDQVCTIAWPEIGATVALKLVGVKRFVDIKRSTFERFADALGLDRGRVAALVDETIARLIDAWIRLRPSEEWRMSAEHAAALRRHWTEVPLLAEHPLPAERPDLAGP